MAAAGWLLDKSAYTCLPAAVDANEWIERIERGLVHLATVTLLEMGYSARSGSDWAAMMAEPPISLMPIEYATPRIERRALDIQGQLARRGHHRAPSIPDLLIAATAEMAGLTLLHRDKDFSLIAETTGQPLELIELAG